MTGDHGNGGKELVPQDQLELAPEYPLWFKMPITRGLQEMLVLKMRFPPGNDPKLMVAMGQEWLKEVWAYFKWERTDMWRIITAFREIKKKQSEWPTLKEYLAQIPMHDIRPEKHFDITRDAKGYEIATPGEPPAPSPPVPNDTPEKMSRARIYGVVSRGVGRDSEFAKGLDMFRVFSGTSDDLLEEVAGKMELEEEMIFRNKNRGSTGRDVISSIEKMKEILEQEARRRVAAYEQRQGKMQDATG